VATRRAKSNDIAASLPGDLPPDMVTEEMEGAVKVVIPPSTQSQVTPGEMLLPNVMSVGNMVEVGLVAGGEFTSTAGVIMYEDDNLITVKSTPTSAKGYVLAKSAVTYVLVLGKWPDTLEPMTDCGLQVKKAYPVRLKGGVVVQNEFVGSSNEGIILKRGASYILVPYGGMISIAL
jgi:hypothetical protein